jgi:hypothetical protein
LADALDLVNNPFLHGCGFRNHVVQFFGAFCEPFHSAGVLIIVGHLHSDLDNDTRWAGKHPACKGTDLKRNQEPDIQSRPIVDSGNTRGFRQNVAELRVAHCSTSGV